jgi:hypothetical protein
MPLNLSKFCESVSDPNFTRTLDISAQPSQTPKLGL